MARPRFDCRAVVRYLPEQSDPAAGTHAFAYTVTIQNRGDIAAQLVARHWTITDGMGRVEDVRGLAVVGRQPLLAPGEAFEYSSWARIDTRQGSMRGRYLCVTEQAEAFHAEVPEFALVAPGALQ